ncbi:glycoside hydrolase superfamily [Morchella snyderi]|nr:glycoside hydrolase superfamily [Morchella snyderi]
MAPVPHPTPRIILYHQTHYTNDGKTYVSLMPLIKSPTHHITHLILAAVHLNALPGDITLNDHPPAHPMFDPLWDEVTALKDRGIKVLFMLGGAAQGTFTRLDAADAAAFEAYYAPLRELLEIYAPHGVDLDVEEPMSLAGIVRLIDRLKADFGPDFIVTLAPVAAALQGGGNISGFSYEALEAARGASVSWYNAQFYCGWGSLEDTRGYEAVVRRGWPPEKVVAGIVTNGRNGAGWVGMDTLQAVLMQLGEFFPGFGGVMGWEYFNCLPGDVEKPWEWVECVGMAIGAPTDTGR